MHISNNVADMRQRVLDLRTLVRHRSVLLFGPRQTGKSTLVRRTFPEAAFYDLLEADTFRQLSTPTPNTSGRPWTRRGGSW